MQQDFNALIGKKITSVCDGYEPFVLALMATKERPLIYIAADGNSLAQTASMLRLTHPEFAVLEFPAWDTVPFDRVSPNANISAQRIYTLSQLVFSEFKQPLVLVTSLGAVLQKLPPAKIFRNARKKIVVGGTLNFDDFLHYIALNGYTRVEQVMEAGEYAVRGDIVDIFPSGAEYPLRVDLFDDEIERLRFFDAITQRTLGELKEYDFQVASEVVLDADTVRNFREKYRELFGAEGMKDEIYEAISDRRKYIGMENWLPLFYEDVLPTLFDYVPNAAVVAGRNVDEALKSKTEGIADYYTARLEALNMRRGKLDDEPYRPIKPEMLYLTADEFEQKLQTKKAAVFSALSAPAGDDVVDMKTIPGRDFAHAKSAGGAAVYAELKDYLNENGKLKRIVCCYAEGSRERLLNLMSEHGIKGAVAAQNWDEAEKLATAKKIPLVLADLAHGFRDGAYCLISEQDILGERRHRKAQKVTSKDLISDVSTLAVGELVVHIEHGIGRFVGLENITAGGAPHDCLKILFAHDDKLFVPVENIDVLSRYGSDDENVQLDVLGGAAWQAKKAKVIMGSYNGELKKK